MMLTAFFILSTSNIVYKRKRNTYDQELICPETEKLFYSQLCGNITLKNVLM